MDLEKGEGVAESLAEALEAGAPVIARDVRCLSLFSLGIAVGAIPPLEILAGVRGYA